MAELDPDRTSGMRFDIVEGDDRTVTVSVGGELDMTNVEALGSAVAPVLGRRPARLIVDARDLRFADSSAIALLVQWANAVPQLEVRDASPLLRKVVASMGLARTLNVTP